MSTIIWALMRGMLLTGTLAAKGGALAAVERSHTGHERPLSEKERDRFEDMLRNLTVSE